ncbi:DUF6612 family protein [Cohnella cholangitidis]|uniref:Lipoprotein n=1 Tax=Cohnella cholangitidis TaxID=2598458 RepID=A0A7G5BXU3_9BACL|nr:DUF6612 family protein [Cohnella cholangitidis]QMV41777.1 hypothetical protein FPL14_11720 [Cohnella cholangitidis]
MNTGENGQGRGLSYMRGWLTFCLMVCLFVVPACSRNDTASSPPASSEAATSEDEATEWLTKAKTAAAQKMNKYGFELRMSQKIGEGNAGEPAQVEIDMQGRAERNPLKLDQTIKSNIDGEASTLRSIVVPEAYYMYIPEYEEWSKLSKDVAAENIATLSDYQVNPDRAIESIRKLGSSLQAARKGNVVTVRYEGTGPEASVFMAGLLESTLGITGEQKDIVNSLEVQKLKVILTLDADRHWPLTYRIESDFNIELEPGQKTTVNQTLAGTYSEHNVSAAITVPKEAQEALDPDELGKELGLE